MSKSGLRHEHLWITTDGKVVCSTCRQPRLDSTPQPAQPSHPVLPDDLSSTIDVLTAVQMNRAPEPKEAQPTSEPSLANVLSRVKQSYDAMPSWMKDQEPPPGMSYEEWNTKKDQPAGEPGHETLQTFNGFNVPSGSGDAEQEAAALKWIAAMDKDDYSEAGHAVTGILISGVSPQELATVLVAFRPESARSRDERLLRVIGEMTHDKDNPYSYLRFRTLPSSAWNCSEWCFRCKLERILGR